MVSNNVWVEATVHPDSAKELDLGWDSVAEPLSKLHITMAFTNRNADEMTRTSMVEFAERLTAVVAGLPELSEYPDGFKVNGVAFLSPGDRDYGVLLLSSQILWSYHTALARELTKDDTLDLTYPGWLPHITICEGVSNYGDQEVLHKLAAKTKTVKLDGLWLRAGRMCLPL